jgi:hypothetical protein
MPSAGFEPAIPANKRPQTYVLDSAATGIGDRCTYLPFYKINHILEHLQVRVKFHEMQGVLFDRHKQNFIPLAKQLALPARVKRH